MITTSKRTVYRGNGARLWRFTKAAAYRDAARAAWWKKHPCECERPEHDTGYPGFTCEGHTDEGRAHRAAVVERLARMWMRRDRQPITTEERALMRRMLGLDQMRRARQRQVAYRNRYFAPKDNVPPMLTDLARRGLVERSGDIAGDPYALFHVTPAGIARVTLPREREKGAAK